MLDLGGPYGTRGKTITVASDDTSQGRERVEVDVRLEEPVMNGGVTPPAVLFEGARGGADGFAYRPDQACLLAHALLTATTGTD